jgi:hypothetical protein
VITPRRTRLVRVASLRQFRSAIAALPGAVVVVPTRSAARLLGTGLTRDELYDLLHARLENPPPRLTAIERDVMAQAAARAAAATGGEPAFRLRPGLVAEMLRFYDHLRRQSQQVKRFEELIYEALGSDDIDRGARRLREQTRFLAAAFREYEMRARASGKLDEHLLRERLIHEPAIDPVRHVVVTVADWIADADGLFVADFDLLSRIPGLESLDIVATERLLGSGFHERLHNWLPGIEEERFESGIKNSESEIAEPGRAVLMTPPAAPPEEPWWTRRDREEELVAVARQLKADRRSGDGVPLDRTAVVYKTPLPYLYLAEEVFGSAGIPFRSSEALPLAAEPTSAALDLVLEAVDADFSRDSLIALLRSPHLRADPDATAVTPVQYRRAIGALDRELSKRRYLGELPRLESLAENWNHGASAAPLRYGLALARQLAPLARPAPASQQIRLLRVFWNEHLAPIDEGSPSADRETRARAAIAAILEALEAIHATHDDPEWVVQDLALAVRRWVEDQTFDVDRHAAGVHLVDDKAAR